MMLLVTFNEYGGLSSAVVMGTLIMAVLLWGASRGRRSNQHDRPYNWAEDNQDDDE